MGTENVGGSNILLLTLHQYCHIINNNTGIVRLVEGPYRGPLESNEAVFGTIYDKVIVKEGQYAVILNPYDKQLEDLRHGDLEIRIGPALFSLHPGEEIDGDRVNDEIVLVEHTGLLLRAKRDFEEEGKSRRAGELWIIEGPARFIPHKYASIVKIEHAISLGLNEGIYVKDLQKGSIRLESGPKTLMLSPHEELYAKTYSPREMEAMGLVEGKFDASRAIPLTLHDAEVVLVVSGEQQRVERGPKVLLLDPFERPYVLSISGSTPKRPNVLKLWKVFVGPVFISDDLCVRTKDNAQLKILVRYKVRFQVDQVHPEKIFTVEDFVGFATETMAAVIRQATAQYSFEEFHSSATEIIKAKIFATRDGNYVFSENGLEIFAIDIKKIVPEDPEIAMQLNSAIKSNMSVYVHKIQQAAELDAERQLVQGKSEIEKTRQVLIRLEQENYEAEKLGAAKIDAQVTIEQARGEAEALKLTSAARLATELDRLKKMLDLLPPESYLRLAQVQAFANVQKTVIVPTNSRLFFPLGQLNALSDPDEGQTRE